MQLYMELVMNKRAEWIDGDDVPAPRGEKLILLTKYGITTVGNWRDDCVAYIKLPNTSPVIKRKMMLFATGKGE